MELISPALDLTAILIGFCQPNVKKYACRLLSPKLSAKRPWTLAFSVAPLPLSWGQEQASQLEGERPRGAEPSELSCLIQSTRVGRLKICKATQLTWGWHDWLSLTSRATQTSWWPLQEERNDSCFQPLSCAVVCYMTISNIQPLGLISSSELWHASWYNPRLNVSWCLLLLTWYPTFSASHNIMIK